MKVELLSPAGDFVSAVGAINAGADAIYLGLKEFSARKSATNFTIDELKDLLEYTKPLGVKVYVAVNTLINNDDFAHLLELIDEVYLLGVSALIIQDYGLLNVCIKRYPDMEIHLSTQVNVTNLDELLHFESLGVKQVVLARELELDKIKKLKENSNVKLETFVHGALCVGYSGNCLFSASIGNRSGNKGDCAQPCRKKYSLLKENEILDKSFLLSPRELSTIEDIDSIIDTGVDSLKIEGRLKGPSFSFYVTNEYRKRIDNKDYKIDFSNLLKVFNREFTSGYILNKDSKDIINYKTNNHIGKSIGVVLENSKNFMKVKLHDNLSINDGVRINNDFGFIVTNIKKNGDLVKNAYKGDVVSVKQEGRLFKKDNILFITKQKSLEYTNKIIERKRTIKPTFIAKLGYMELNYKDISVSSEYVEKSINRPNTIKEIDDTLTKTGKTPYNLEIDYDVEDNLFINNKELNKLRQNFIHALDDTFNEKRSINYSLDLCDKPKFNDCFFEVVVETIEQLEIVKNYPFRTIFTRNIELVSDSIKYCTTRVKTSDLTLKNTTLLVSDYSYFDKGNKLVGSSYLNVYNDFTISSLLQKGFSHLYLSHELTYNEIKKLSLNKYSSQLGITVYSKIDLMISKSCPIKNHYKTEVGCGLCEKNNFYIQDEYNNKIRIIKDDECNVRLIDFKETNKINDIEKFKQLGITKYLVDFTVESKEEIKNVLDQVFKY